jgi:phosphomannomutase
LVIGYDNRFASEDFARAAAEVVAANGIKVYLGTRATPTPAISYGVLTQKAGGAIIITASHNPAIWNGFKYKTEDGTSAPDEVTAEIEKRLSTLTADKIKRLPLPQALEKGTVEYFDLAPLYIKQLNKLIDLKPIRQSKLKVIFDPMYGAGAGYLKTMLGGGNLELLEINGERNPLFPGIQPEPIAANLNKLLATVQKEKADVGLATDGDADRVGIIDEKGNFLNQLQVFALLCLYLLEVRGERGAMVRTITSTTMIDRLGELFKVPVYETPPERDGILAGIYFLDFMLQTGKTPSQLLDYLYSKVGPHYYQRRDFGFPKEKRQAIIKGVGDNLPQAIDGVKVAKVNDSDGFHLTLADTSWLLIRFSGTEPVLRIYAESDSPVRVERLLAEGQRLAGI